MGEMTAQKYKDEKLAKEALSNIIYFIGADSKYTEYAQLLTYIEDAIKKGREQ